jgi:hypothetical protein
MRDIVGWIAFAILQVLFIPLAIVGVGGSMYKQVCLQQKAGRVRNGSRDRVRALYHGSVRCSRRPGCRAALVPINRN